MGTACPLCLLIAIYSPSTVTLPKVTFSTSEQSLHLMAPLLPFTRHLFASGIALPATPRLLPCILTDGQEGTGIMAPVTVHKALDLRHLDSNLSSKLACY